MPKLRVKTRKKKGSQLKSLRREGILPGVLYGPKVKSKPVEVDLKKFKKIYEKAEKSSLIDLGLDKKEVPVLVHEVQKDPLSDEIIHVDFYAPSLKEKVETTVPLVFEGESEAVKKEGGTLVKDIVNLKIKAPPRNIPDEIKVNIEQLKTFDDDILIKDLKVPEEVEILRDPNDIVASVVPPKEVEEELEKPIEEEIEEVETVKEAKEKEEVEKAVEAEEEKETPEASNKAKESKKEK